MTRQIFAAEVNFQDTPRLVREKFIDTEKNIKRLLLSFRRRVDEVFIFSNRHRFTVYIFNENMKPLTEFFQEEHPLKGYVQYYYNSGESVTHLMATTSGLLSAVKGDGGVLSEVNRCLEWARDCACLGMTLDQAVRRAMNVGKKVRTETAIDKYCASVVETGIELLYNRLQDVHRMNFLIVGTGELAKLALKVLFEEGITNVVIVGDEVEAVRLAERFGIRSVDVSRLADYFIHADVVIAVGAEEIDKDNLPPLRAEGLRDKGNRIILDMGVPPNFEAETAGMLAEEYYSLDDLRRLQPSPLEAFGGVEAAWRMVLRSAGDFCFLLQLLQHSPVLNAYLSRQFAIKNVDLQSKPRKKVRSMFTFLKSDNILRVDRVKGDVNMRVQLNNHVAEDASDVVKNVKKVRRFNYWLSDN